VRKLPAIVMMLLLSIVLVSCGAGDDEEAEPTAEPTTVVESEPTTSANVGIPGTPAIEVDEDEATPVEVTVVATPAPANATPAVSNDASPMASPVVAASPVTSSFASPVASPVASPQMIASLVASPTETPVVMIEMMGLVTLDGVENTAYILTDEGCVGLGQYSGLHDGRQVVVRNEAGTIISVASLEAAEGVEGCAWDFVVQVPESDFYSVSIPMVFEQVFPQAQVRGDNGKVVIALP
jgi:hypothetical protein